MFKVFTFAPKDSTSKIIEAMSSAGAGIIGNYTHCTFITSGMGNWKSEEGAHPTIGEIGQMTQAPEDKVEILCPDEKLEAVIVALRNAHPYEEPEIDIVKLFELPN